MMEVNFAVFSKRENSTAHPVNTADWTKVDCDLKQPCSVLHPVFILPWNFFTRHYNYVYVRTFGRYYYVSDITYLTGNRAECACTYDPLASYDGAIKAYLGYVERTSDVSQVNRDIADELTSNSLDIITKASAETEFNAPFDIGGCYVLRTVSESGVQTYAMRDGTLKNALDFMFTSSNYSDVLSDASVKAVFNPFQYILSLRWLPLGLDSIVDSAATETIKFGWWDSGVSVHPLSTVGAEFYTRSALRVPRNSYGDWRKRNSTFSHYSLYLPSIGTIDLNPSDINENMYVTGEIDIVTGDTEYFLTEGGVYSPSGGSAVIATYRCKLGIDIQIGQLALDVGKAAGGIGSAVGSLLTGNILGAAAGAVNAIQTINQPTMSINGTQSAEWLINRAYRVIVSLECYGSGDTPQNVAGSPCYKRLRLSDLTKGSYAKCGGASVSLPSAYDAETTAVNNYLNSGVYLD